MARNKTFVTLLLGFFLIYVLLESGELVEPKQFHEPAVPISQWVSIVQTTPVVGTASIYPGSVNLTPDGIIRW